MRRAVLALALATLALAATAPAASAGFGFKTLALKVLDAAGNPALQAGSHPFAFKTELVLNGEINPELGSKEVPAGQLKDLSGTFSPGLTGNPFAVPQCSAVDFAATFQTEKISRPDCSDSSVVGLIRNRVLLADNSMVVADNSVYNLVPPPGVAARLGFRVYGASVPPVVIDLGIKDTPPYNLTFAVRNVTQMVRVFTSDLTVWGNPSESAHDEDRGSCGVFVETPNEKNAVGGSCPTTSPNIPFLTLPRSCNEPVGAIFRATSWLGDIFEGSAITEDAEGKPQSPGGCAKLAFDPRISAAPTNRNAAGPSGLDVDLDVEDEGLQDPNGTAASDLKKVVLTLPEGVTINPSQAEGLAVCSEADFARETAGSEFGDGCPAASKIGTVEAETPQLKGKILKGSLFVAEPFKNPSRSLIALYMVIKEPQLGIGIKLPGKVAPDPTTGQIVSTFDDLPQQPLSHVRVHLREGGRSPLITPSHCGTYTTKAELTPWADPGNPLQTTSSFQITGGVNGGPCPSGGVPPFEPGFEAGTLNNNAGSFSPFYMRLTRRDGDQDLTRFAAKLPPGVVAKLAGTTQCPPAQIALARSKTGKAELASPSCPSSSEIGHVIGGAGVGSELTYVPGKLYLAGPYNGAPISVVAVVPAVAGPFDVGDVVVQQALRVDPRTGEVQADGAASDPLPHILAGIPLSVRDIRVYVDKPDFTLNPTSCEPSKVAAQIWGGGSNVFSSLDDSPVSKEARFQAAGCRGLGFKPALSLRLKGGTRRGSHPALHAVVRPRAGDANIEGAVVRLPRSAFLDQAHIRTICTRVQFAAGPGHGARCPEGSVYGHVEATTPLLSEPLSGPVYLRSSDHNLPDLVFALHGLVDFEAVGRIDSKHGGIRTTFTKVPDAPVSKVVLDMQGGKKGLIVNSTDLCAGPHRVNALFSAHNGKQRTLQPLLRASCGTK